MKNRLRAKEVAKLVRSELKKHFKDVKFSVRTSTYTGGSSITVKWQDGPSESEVKAVIGDFHGADFDGMQDLKTYRRNEYGNDFIFTERRFGVDFLEKVAQIVAKEYHTAPVEVVESTLGAHYAQTNEYLGNTTDFHWNMEQVSIRKARELSANEVETLYTAQDQNIIIKNNIHELASLGIM